MKKEIPASIPCLSHDAPTCTVSARFIDGSTTIHDGSATIHHGGATNAHEASKIRLVLVRFKPVAPRHPPHTVFLMNRDESA